MAERLPFPLWWQQIQAQQRSLGLQDDVLDESVKYAVEIPGFKDVIHIIPRAKVSKDEMEAHRAALRRKLSSPLSAGQLDTLKWKKETFLKILRSPTPPEVREIGWYINQVENVGDMMTAAFWGGKGLIWALGKIGLAAKGPLAKYAGWALVAKDVADIINLMRVARSTRGFNKKQGLKDSSMNPFNKTMKASRALKLKARLPGIPDWLEIAQVTDQAFGVGISFGPIVGFITDGLFGVRKGAEVKGLGGGVDLKQFQ